MRRRRRRYRYQRLKDVEGQTTHLEKRIHTMKQLHLVALVGAVCCSRALQLYGVNYTPRQGPDWAPWRCKDYGAIAADLATLQQITGRVRIYSLAGCNAGELVLRAARALEMKVWLGMWGSDDPAVFAREKQKLGQLIDGGWITEEQVLGLHVGSEAIYRRDITVAQVRRVDAPLSDRSIDSATSLGH